MSLVSLAAFSRVLDLREYGTYRQVLLVFSTISPLLSLGLPQALYFFLPGEEGSPRRILSENLLLLFAAGGLFTAFLALGGNRLLAWCFRNPELAGALWVFSAYPLVAIPLRALEPCLMARDRPKQVAVFNVASRVLLLAAVLVVALWWQTVRAALLATVLASALVLALGIMSMFRACPGPFERPTSEGVWKQIRFGVPLGVAGLFGILTLKLGQVIVSAMCLPEDFAIYANGAIELPLIGVITGSATAVLMPELAQHFKAGERPAALHLWQRSMVKCSTILLPAMAFLMVCAPDMIKMLFSARYEAAVTPFRILLFALPIRATNFGAMFLAANANRLILYRSALDILVSAILTVLLVTLLGMPGAAVATVLAIYIWTVPYNVYFIGRVYRSPIWSVLPLKRLALVLIGAVVASMAILPVLFLLQSWPAWARLSSSAVIFGLVVVLAFSALRLDEFHRLIGAVTPKWVARILWRLGIPDA